MIELRDELRATAMRVGNTAQLLAVRIEVPASEGAALCIFEAAPRGAHRHGPCERWLRLHPFAEPVARMALAWHPRW